eukprot:359283-Hanusia_phi.AAC.2
MAQQKKSSDGKLVVKGPSVHRDNQEGIGREDEVIGMGTGKRIQQCKGEGKGEGGGEQDSVAASWHEAFVDDLPKIGERVVFLDCIRKKRSKS